MTAELDTDKRPHLGVGLCRVLGLDPNAIQAITLEFKGGDYVTCHIERVVAADEIRGWMEGIGGYELAPKGWRELIDRG